MAVTATGAPLVATVILGLLWDAWHYPLYVKSILSTGSGIFHFTVGVLCYTAMMTVLFCRTRGSVLLAMVFFAHPATPSLPSLF